MRRTLHDRFVILRCRRCSRRCPSQINRVPSAELGWLAVSDAAGIDDEINVEIDCIYKVRCRRGGFGVEVTALQLCCCSVFVCPCDCVNICVPVCVMRMTKTHKTPPANLLY